MGAASFHSHPNFPHPPLGLGRTLTQPCFTLKSPLRNHRALRESLDTWLGHTFPNFEISVWIPRSAPRDRFWIDPSSCWLKIIIPLCVQTWYQLEVRERWLRTSRSAAGAAGQVSTTHWSQPQLKQARPHTAWLPRAPACCARDSDEPPARWEESPSVPYWVRFASERGVWRATAIWHKKSLTEHSWTSVGRCNRGIKNPQWPSDTNISHRTKSPWITRPDPTLRSKGYPWRSPTLKK